MSSQLFDYKFLPERDFGVLFQYAYEILFSCEL